MNSKKWSQLSSSADSDSDDESDTMYAGIMKVLWCSWFAGIIAGGSFFLRQFALTNSTESLVYGLVLVVEFPANAMTIMIARKSIAMKNEITLSSFRKQRRMWVVYFLLGTTQVATVVLAIGLWIGLVEWGVPCIIAFGFPGFWAFLDIVVDIVDLSCHLVRRVVNKIETAGDVDWDVLMAEAFHVQTKIDTLWSISQAGAPIFLSIAQGIVSIATSIALHILRSASDSTVLAFFSVGCVLAAGPLALASRVTRLCRDTSMGAPSIPAALSRYAEHFEGKCEKDKAAYGRFLLLLHSDGNPLGVRVAGTLITTQLVATSYFKIGVLLPTAYGLAQQMLTGAS